MKNMWLLPDREQSGRIQAVEAGKVCNLDELIDLSELPPELVLGSPEEVYRSKQGEFFLFAQWATLSSGTPIFCLSAPAGKDLSGRCVSISNLQILENGEEPLLELSIPDLPSRVDRDVVRTIIKTLQTGDRDVVAPVKRMLEAVKDYKDAGSFASEPLRVAKNKPDWMPKRRISDFIKDAYPQVPKLIVLGILFPVIGYLCIKFW